MYVYSYQLKHLQLCKYLMWVKRRYCMSCQYILKLLNMLPVTSDMPLGNCIKYCLLKTIPLNFPHHCCLRAINKLSKSYPSFS